MSRDKLYYEKQDKNAGSRAFFVLRVDYRNEETPKKPHGSRSAAGRRAFLRSGFGCRPVELSSWFSKSGSFFVLYYNVVYQLFVCVV